MFKGGASMSVSEATMIEAVQEFLTSRIKPTPHVQSVLCTEAYGSRTFTINFDDGVSIAVTER